MVNINRWRYYNKAVVPNIAPHDIVDESELERESFWKKWEPNKPLFVRWSSNFDCGYETNWWYIIRDGKFDLETLSKSSRKKIRRSLSLCSVVRIDPLQNIENLYNVYLSAVKKYKEYQHVMSIEEFKKHCIDSSLNGEEWWGGYDIKSSRLIGYKSCAVKDGFMEMKVSKYSVEYLNLRVSDALNYVVIDHYMNKEKVKYVLNGSRAINHVTNVQEYYIERFGFRKAYCLLHIKYKKPFNFIINILYPFRNIIPNKIPMAHQIKAVLKMEEIVRNQRKKV